MTGDITRLDEGFSARLKALRVDRLLTQADLADKAGISVKSVQNLESQKQPRAQTRTVMLLAEALDVSYGALTTPTEEGEGESRKTAETNPARPRFPRVLISVVIAVVAGLAALVFGMLTGREIDIDEHSGFVEVRDSIFGRVVWQQDFADEIIDWRLAPWDDGVLLIGLKSRALSEGTLVAFDIRSGRELWNVGPDFEAMAQAFDPEFVYGGTFKCRKMIEADLDGDHVSELVVNFMHSKWYPGAICVVTPDGRIDSQYASRGLIADVVAGDIDNDGRDEIVCAGTNNTPEYQGATVFILDNRHRGGAGIDPITTPGSSVPDSSLVRIVVPAWPYEVMDVAGAIRLDATGIRLHRRESGAFGIQVDIGIWDFGHYVVDFDHDLRPLALNPSDTFIVAMVQAGLPHETWDRSWMDGHFRFERGQAVEAALLP